MTKTTGVKNRRLLITKNSILMLVMLVIIFLAIFAWYFINKSVDAEGITVSAVKPEEVQIALPNSNDKLPDDGAFGSNVEFANSGFCTKLIKDVTSDGHQFVVPAFDTTDESNNTNGKTVLTAGDWTDGLSSRAALSNNDEFDDDKYNYISLDFYLRSSSPRISLCENSYLAAYSELQTGSNAKISSINYDEAHGGDDIQFSRDALVGAMRVSLEKFDVTFSGNTEANYNGEPTRTLLWLPRPDIYVNTSGAANTWTLNYVAPNNTSYNYITYRHTFYKGETVQNTVKRGVTQTTYYDSNTTSGDAFSSGGATSPDFFKVTRIPQSDYNKIGTPGFFPKFGQSAQVASGGSVVSVSDTRFSKPWYIYRMRLNVWIEGADAEARRAMNDGRFKLHLEFK